MTYSIADALLKTQTALTLTAQNNPNGSPQKDCAKALKLLESIAPRAAVWGATSTDAVGRLLDRVYTIANLITGADQSKSADLNLAVMALADAVQADDLLTYVPDPELRRLLRSKYSINTMYDLTQRASPGVGIGITNADTTTIASAEGVQYGVNLTDLTIRTIGASLTYVPFLGGLRKLTSLNLSGNPSLASVSGLGAMTALASLNLADDTGLTLTERLDALVNLVTFDVHNTGIGYLGNVSGWNKLTSFKIHQCLFLQTDLEAIVDQLWANRVALGALACAIDLRLNPRIPIGAVAANSVSAAVATSRATQITDLRNAGCTVQI